MEAESLAEEKDPIQQLETKNIRIAQPQGLEQQITSEDHTIQKKVDQQLYLHFQQFLEKFEWHYYERSQLFEKKPSKQQLLNQTIKYLKPLKKNIKPLHEQHYQQLLLLIDYLNKNNELITNKYTMILDQKDSTDSAKFYLDFHEIKERIDLKQLVSFNNWHHLRKLGFSWTSWVNDDDWRALVEHADNFKNLKWLQLVGNRITQIKEGDIEQFKSLNWINLGFNPLSEQSKEVLRRLKQNNKQMQIHFNQVNQSLQDEEQQN